MKRLSLRLSLCVVAAAATCVPLMPAQAETHKPFYSRLNPKTWFKKSEPEGRAKIVDEQSQIVPGSATTSVRPHLTEDPFAIPLTETAKSPSSVEKPRTQTADRSTPQIAPSVATRSAVNDAANDFEEFGSSKKPNATKAGEAPSAEARVARKPASKGGANQFEEGFDDEFNALVKSVKSEQSSAPALPDLAEANSGITKTVRQRDRERQSASANEATGLVSDAAKGALSEFEQFAAEQASSVTAANTDTPVEQRRVAKSASQSLAKPKRELLDPDSTTTSGSSDAIETRDVIATSRRGMESSILRGGLAQDASSKDGREAAGSRLTQTSGTTPRSTEKTLIAPRTSASQLPEVRSSLAARDDMPLIVPNDQVPERRLYVASQSYRAATSTSAASNQSAATETALVPTITAPRVAPMPQEEITPRVSANRAPALTLPEPSKVRQLAYEDQAPVESRLPLLSIGGGMSAPAADESATGPLLFPTSSLDGDIQDTVKADKSVRETAPTIDWPDAADATAPTKKKSSALVMVLAIVGVGLGLGYMLRRKAAVVTTGGTAVGDSPEIRS